MAGNQKSELCSSEDGVDCELGKKPIGKRCLYHRSLYAKNHRRKRKEAIAPAKNSVQSREVFKLCETCVKEERKTGNCCPDCKKAYNKRCRKNTNLRKLTGK